MFLPSCGQALFNAVSPMEKFMVKWARGWVTLQPLGDNCLTLWQYTFEFQNLKLKGSILHSLGQSLLSVLHQGPCVQIRRRWPLILRNSEPVHGEEVNGNIPVVSCSHSQSIQGPGVNTFFACGMLLTPGLTQHSHITHLFHLAWVFFYLASYSCPPTACPSQGLKLSFFEFNPLFSSFMKVPGLMTQTDLDPTALTSHLIQRMTSRVTCHDCGNLSPYHRHSHKPWAVLCDLGPAMFSGGEDADLKCELSGMLYAWV